MEVSSRAQLHWQNGRPVALGRKKGGAVPTNRIPPGCEVITPQMLPLVSLEQEHIDEIARAMPGGGANIQDIYPLTPLQEGILFHHVFEERGDVYVVPVLLEWKSHAQLNAFIAALLQVIVRYDTLRSAVMWERLPMPVQVVCRQVSLPVEEVTLDPNRKVDEQLQEWLRPERQRMDVRRAPLLRLRKAAQPGGACWYLMLQFHHAAMDHESAAMLVEEIATFIKGRGDSLPEPFPFRSHVAQTLEYARTPSSEAFFTAQFGDIDEPTAPYGVLGAPEIVYAASAMLDASQAQPLRTWARRLRVNVATLFHAAWALVAAGTSGRDDVVFGTVLFGRLQTTGKAQRKFGMFLNTLPMRLRLQGVMVRDLISRAQSELLQLLGHEQVSLAQAQRCSGLPGSTPLFTALLNYRHSAAQSVWSCLEGVRELAVLDRSSYPLTLSVDDLGGAFKLTVQADARIDPHRMVGYMLTALHSFVQALESSPETPALSLSILPQSERRQVLELFNATEAPYPHGKLVHQLFEEQVARSPTAVAVVFEEQHLTYAELNARANQLARYLIRQGVGPDQRVALYVERSLEMVVGLLGILKAGGAYVPLDPGYPAERLQYVLEDAAPKVLLTQQALLHNLPRSDAALAVLDEDWGVIASNGVTNLDTRELDLASGHLAYVIYTSGSTGRPKGVMISHSNIVAFCQGLEHTYERADCRRVALNASFTFDASVQQIMQLLRGRTLSLIPEACRRDPTRLLSYLEVNRIDGLDCTPSQLKSWVAAGLLERQPFPLRMVLVGGEVIETALWNRLRQCGCMDFYNVYGPTECTVEATLARIENDGTPPHIGRPMQNRRVYILGSHHQPVPLGVVGEIYIAGVGVGRGYLNRPELTAERFVRDPFSADPEARMYRTGDLGRWREDGAIEYLGRNDHQVKIRGFRIELGEIEAQLSQHDQVKEAVVVVREDVAGEKRLVAYVTPRQMASQERTSHEAGGGPALSAEVLRSHLKGVLPDYMVPSAFVVLQSLPLTPNGKLDRRALPAPELGAYASRQYEAPQGEIEEILAGIWQSLLQLERVGRHDNFFELGGHSLTGVKLIERVAATLNIQPSVATVFRFPTISQMASFVAPLCSESRRSDSSPIELQEGTL